MSLLSDDFERSCGRKKWFTSKKFAKAAAKSMRQTTGQRYTVYECWFCHRYHVAHNRRLP